VAGEQVHLVLEVETVIPIPVVVVAEETVEEANLWVLEMAVQE
jgi:hypothetical protein